MASQVTSAVPILFVRDVPAAAAWWRDKAGFSIDFQYGEPQPFYAGLRRGGARLHLRHVRDPNFAALAAREPSLILASFEVTDVEAIHADLMARGAEVVEPLTRHPWGGHDFQIRDPDGNRVSFVEYGL